MMLDEKKASVTRHVWQMLGMENQHVELDEIDENEVDYNEFDDNDSYDNDSDKEW